MSFFVSRLVVGGLWSMVQGSSVRDFRRQSLGCLVQCYLSHERMPLLPGLAWGPRLMPTVRSYWKFSGLRVQVSWLMVHGLWVRFSSERGTPVQFQTHPTLEPSVHVGHVFRDTDLYSSRPSLSSVAPLPPDSACPMRAPDIGPPESEGAVTFHFHYQIFSLASLHTRSSVGPQA